MAPIGQPCIVNQWREALSRLRPIGVVVCGVDPRGREVKLNAAAILREDALYKKKQLEEAGAYYRPPSTCVYASSQLFYSLYHHCSDRVNCRK